MTLTLRFRFRPRPAAVRLACTACESRRAWLRSNDVRRWDPFRAACPACAARAAAPPSPCRDSGVEALALSA